MSLDVMLMTWASDIGQRFISIINFAECILEAGPLKQLRRRIYEIMEAGHGVDAAARMFDVFIVTLIILNIAAFALETVPSLNAQYGTAFFVFEVFSVVVFTIEYLLRLWVAVEVPFLSGLPSWKARLRFAMRPPQVVDLLAILPFYLHAFIGLDLRVLRTLRLLRFLKLSRYSPALHTLVRVLTNESRALAGAGLLLFAAVLFAATGIYFIEGEEQPDKFGSVPASMWWAIATLTTVGYGDVAPVTALGRAFGGFVMVTGLCVLALPVAIISTGFAQEVSRRDFVVNWSLMSRIPLFAELDSREVADIMPLLHAYTLPPHVEVISEGSPGDAMYFIASGRARFCCDGREVIYEAGEFFGSVAMLKNDVNHGKVITLKRTRVLKLHREDFARLAGAKPEVARHIREIADARLKEREDIETTQRTGIKLE